MTNDNGQRATEQQEGTAEVQSSWLMRYRAAIAIGVVALVFIAMWAFEKKRHDALKSSIESDRQVTLQKIISVVDEDLTAVSGNFDHYRQFGDTILDSTTWYVKNVAPMVEEYSSVVEYSTSALAFAITYIPAAGPLLGKLVQKVADGIETTLEYSNQFNDYISLIGETNATMDEIQKQQQEFRQTRSLQTLYQLNKSLDLEFLKKLQQIKGAAVEIENALGSVEAFLDDTLETAREIEAGLQAFEEKYDLGEEEEKSENEESVLRSLKETIKKKVAITNQKMIAKARAELSKLTVKLEANIKNLRLKAKPFKEQVLTYTTKMSRDFDRVSRITAGVQIIELLESESFQQPATNSN